ASLFMTPYSGYRFFAEKSRFQRIPELIATFFYVCCLPKVPGTFGTVAGLTVGLLLWKNSLAYIIFTIVITFLGIAASHLYAATINVKDPGQVVIDEVSGILISFLGMPLKIHLVIAGFFIFRLFDIVKPPPLRRLEYLP